MMALSQSKLMCQGLKWSLMFKSFRADPSLELYNDPCLTPHSNWLPSKPKEMKS